MQVYNAEELPTVSGTHFSPCAYTQAKGLSLIIYTEKDDKDKK